MRALLLVLAFVTSAMTPATLEAGPRPRVIRTVIHELSIPGVNVLSMNNGGTIVGRYAPDLNAGSYPFRWSRSRGIDLFLGSRPGVAIDVNDGGAIVGVLEEDENSQFGFSGFLWTPGGGLVELGEFAPFAINSLREIAGICDGFSGLGRFCIWQNGEVIDLGSGGALGINGRGVVVGQIGLEAIKWSRRSDVVTLPNSATGPSLVYSARDVNNRGEIVGQEATDGVVSYPVRWDKNGVVEALTQYPRGGFWAINESGLALGGYPIIIDGTAFSQAFLHTADGEIIQLGEGFAVALNDRGLALGMVGLGLDQKVVIWRLRKR
jgi:hypothetical protein